MSPYVAQALLDVHRDELAWLDYKHVLNNPRVDGSTIPNSSGIRHRQRDYDIIIDYTRGLSEGDDVRELISAIQVQRLTASAHVPVQPDSNPYAMPQALLDVREDVLVERVMTPYCVDC